MKRTWRRHLCVGERHLHLLCSVLRVVSGAGGTSSLRCTGLFITRRVLIQTQNYSEGLGRSVGVHCPFGEARMLVGVSMGNQLTRRSVVLRVYDGLLGIK